MSGSESVPEDWGDPTPPVEPQGRRHLFLPRRDGVSIRAAAPTCWNPVEPPPPDCCPEDVCFFFSLQLTVTIRALLQNLKEKIALLKDLLLRAVSTHQMYPCKTFPPLCPQWEEVQSYFKKGRDLGHPNFSTA